MSGADVLSMSWSNLGRRKGRTALTAAGVIVGVAALVLLISLGLGLQRQIASTFQSQHGLRTVRVSRVKAASRDRETPGFSLFDLQNRILPLTDRDLTEMKAVPSVTAVQPDLGLWLDIEIQRKDGSMGGSGFEVAGVLTSETERYEKALVAGELWKKDERACLLPLSLLGIAFGTVEPKDVVGSRVVFSKAADEEGADPPEERVCTVAGVLDQTRLGLFGNKVYLPMERALELRKATEGGAIPFFYKEGTYLFAEVRVDRATSAKGVAARLRHLGYQAQSADELLGRVNLVFLILKGVLASIGAIGLLVSLFGIANTMAMAVLERTREIGIMKALGARNRDVGRIFLAEAAIIGALGGIVGVALGYLVGVLLNALARGVFDFGPDVSLFHVSLWLAGGSVVFSMIVSVLAGALPARRAARLEPIAALRYE